MAEPKHRIQICMGSSCFSRGNGLNAELLQRLVSDGEPLGVEIAGSLCAGRCKDGPIIVVDGIVHAGVTPTTLQDILAAQFGAGAGSGR